MQTAFVTGGTGFIGRHVVDSLLARGVAVRALVRSPARAHHLQRDGVELVPGSLDDMEPWRRSLAGCDVVFHCAGLVAARSSRDLTRTNGTAVGNFADVCSRIETPPPVIHLSSLAAAGPVPRHASPRDEARPANPVSEYGRSKLMGEAELSRRSDRLPITIIRPGIVFGPHELNFAAMFQSIQWTRVHAMMGFRSPKLSLIHVADLVRFIVAAAARGRRLQACQPDGDGIYHACDDREFPTHAQLGHRLARALGTWALVMPLPLVIAFPATFAIATYWHARGQASIVSPDKVREAIAPSWAASAARARADFGFEPGATLDERLGETARWLRDHGQL